MLQIYVKGVTDTFSLCALKARAETNHIKRVMNFAHHIICAAFHFVI